MRKPTQKRNMIGEQNGCGSGCLHAAQWIRDFLASKKS